ncbi:MAG: carbohydate-binding domain-containing protein [Bacteroidota bacterium]
MNQKYLPGDWQIFFNLRYHRYDLASNTKGVTISHVNGELFVITPTAEFISAKSFKVEFTGGRRIANFQDVPSGFFYVGGDDKAVEITRTVVTPTNIDLPTASEEKVTDVAEPVKVLPAPAKYSESRGSFTINKETTIKSDFDTKYFVNEIENLTGYNWPKAQVQSISKK